MPTLANAIDGVSTATRFINEIGLVVTLSLVVVVIGKEIVTGLPNRRFAQWNRPLNVVLVPLLTMFIVVLVATVARTLD